MKVFLAKQHLNRLKEDAINSARKMLENGLWPVNAPFGYKNVTLPNKKKWIEVDSPKAAIVKKIYEWYGTASFSMKEIVKKVRETFSYKIAKGMVDKILKNSFYYGLMCYKEETHWHKYECLIDKSVFDKAQEIKAGFKRKHFKYAGIPYFYRGLITCAKCGCTITPEKKKGKYIYYHCTEFRGKHGAKWVSETDITEQLSKIYKGMEVPEKILLQLTKTLKESHEGKKRFNDELFNELTIQFKKYQNRIEKMYEDKLDGAISQEDYDKRLEEYKDKQEEISQKLSNLKRADEEYYLTSEYILKLASKASELFLSSEMEERRQLLQLSLQNLQLDGKIVRFILKKPFDVILKYGQSQRWLPALEEIRNAVCGLGL